MPKKIETTPDPSPGVAGASDRVVLLLLIVILAVAYSDILLFGRGFYALDVHSYHYPMKQTVRDLVLDGEMPYWDTRLSSGKPLAANPAYELWYPPQWLIFLPSFHFGFQLHIVIHFLIAAIGMFVLVRSLGGSPQAAGFAALAFTFCGPYLSLSSKLTMLFACSWMPLTLFFVRQVVIRWRWPFVAGAALSLGMQLLLGEPTFLLQTGGFIAGFVLLRAWQARGETLKRDVLRIAIIGLFAVLVGAAQLVPAADFARDTIRVQPFPYEVVTNWSMPLVRPLEMLLPSLFSHVEGEDVRPAITSMYALRSEPFLGSIYVGAFVAILALAGVLGRVRGAGAFVVVLIISAIAAAGEHTPLARILYDLHLIRSLRYPEKFVLSAALATIVWAALLFDRLHSDPALARRAFQVALVVAVIVLIGALGAKAEPLDARSYFAMNLLRAAVVLAFVGPLRKKLRPTPWAAALIVLVTIDLLATTRPVAERAKAEFFEPPALAASLPDTTEGRIFHQAAWDTSQSWRIAQQWLGNKVGLEFNQLLRSGLFPNLPNLYGRALALEEDIDRTSLQSSEEFRQVLMRAHADGRSQEFLQLQRMANVKWRMGYRRFAESESEPVEIEPVDGYPRFVFADAIVNPFRTALMQPDIVVSLDEEISFNPAPGTVQTLSERPNAIDLATSSRGRGLLLISITGHKYWTATIDGLPAPLLRANLAFQALDVPAGDHLVTLRYRNPLVIPSAVVSLLTVLALVLLTIRYRRVPGETQPPSASEPVRERKLRKGKQLQSPGAERRRLQIHR